jgi:hypothetical protein
VLDEPFPPHAGIVARHEPELGGQPVGERAARAVAQALGGAHDARVLLALLQVAVLDR